MPVVERESRLGGSQAARYGPDGPPSLVPGLVVEGLPGDEGPDVSSPAGGYLFAIFSFCSFSCL